MIKIVLLFLTMAGLYHYDYWQDFLRARERHPKYVTERYKLIKKVINNYTRPFTLIDVGARQSYYAVKAAADYDTVSVILEHADTNTNVQSTHSKALDVCREKKNLSNLILLNKIITPCDLQHLGECEHFDTVLALNIIEIFGDEWLQATEAILSLGDNIIIEIPKKARQAAAMQDFLHNKNTVVLGNLKESSLYLVQTDKKYLIRKNWFLPPSMEKKRVVTSNYREKYLTKQVAWPKNTYLTTSWLPGINLITFKMLNGIYPALSVIKESIRTTALFHHEDWTINNMILQGNKVVLIDFNDPAFGLQGPAVQTPFSGERYAAHCTMLDLKDPINIEHYFWYTLVETPVNVQNIYRLLMRVVPKQSKIFAIGRQTAEQLAAYIEHKGDVVYVNSAIDMNQSFDKAITIDKTASEKIVLDTLMSKYGIPQLCVINVNNSLAVLKTLKEPSINCITVTFATQDQVQMHQCIKYLAQIGYTKANFIGRTPRFGLTEWIDIAMVEREIVAFAQKDHDVASLRITVYVKNR